MNVAYQKTEKYEVDIKIPYRTVRVSGCKWKVNQTLSTLSPNTTAINKLFCEWFALRVFFFISSR